MSWLWWAPLVAAALHIFEEFVYPGGFAAWDRDYRPGIRASITPRLHVVMNALLLYGGLSVAIAGRPGGVLAMGGVRLRSPIPSSFAVPCWLGLAALLASNAVFHLLGSWRTHRVSPGVRTGLLLYVPMAVIGTAHFLRTGQVSVPSAAAAALVGGSYHFWAAIGHRWRSRAAAVAAGRGRQ
jgi:hypothetical protein